MRPLAQLRLERLKLTPGQEWCAGASAWRFVRCDSGAAYWLGAPKPRFFSEGELLVMAPHSTGIVRASQLNEVILSHFDFAADLLGGFFTVTEQHALAAGRDQVTPVQFLPSTHHFSQRFALLAGQSQFCPLVQRVELLGLAIGFLSETARLTNSSMPSQSSAESRFEEIISKMPDTELLHYTTLQLAQLCGCSLRHFHRLFHQRFGESPRTRQTELRLLQSRQLLTSTDQDIVQIARASGYRSISLFNSLFKRRFGMSPSAWREQIRNP
jgi:AraC-like DNA-binding protein